MPLAAALPYIALGASAAGTGLSIAGNEESQSAMNAARANEVNQQAALQKQSNAIFQNSLAQSTPQTAQQQMQQGQAARTSAWQGLQNATTPVASALPTTTSGSTTGSSPTGGGTPTSGASARAVSAGNSWNTLLANAAAREGSYGDWQNQQAIKNANAAQQLGVVNNFSQGDAALLPTELQVASQTGDSLSGWGSIVSSLGNLAGYANKSGIFGSPTPAVTPTDGASVANWANGPGLYNSIASANLPASAGISSSYNYPMTNAMLSGGTYQPPGNVWADLNR